jgi:hypothetical protein
LDLEGDANGFEVTDFRKPYLRSEYVVRVRHRTPVGYELVMTYGQRLHREALLPLESEMDMAHRIEQESLLLPPDNEAFHICPKS